MAFNRFSIMSNCLCLQFHKIFESSKIKSWLWPTKNSKDLIEHTHPKNFRRASEAALYCNERKQKWRLTSIKIIESIIRQALYWFKIQNLKVVARPWLSLSFQPSIFASQCIRFPLKKIKTKKLLATANMSIWRQPQKRLLPKHS